MHRAEVVVLAQSRSLSPLSARKEKIPATVSSISPNSLWRAGKRLRTSGKFAMGWFLKIEALARTSRSGKMSSSVGDDKSPSTEATGLESESFRLHDRMVVRFQGLFTGLLLFGVVAGSVLAIVGEKSLLVLSTLPLLDEIGRPNGRQTEPDHDFREGLLVFLLEVQQILSTSTP